MCAHMAACRYQNYQGNCRESVDILDMSVNVQTNFCNYKNNNDGVIYQFYKIINSMGGF